jgi:AAA15 family ATPase/GTPase
MLAKFKVSNFKSFKDDFFFDLTDVGKYEFGSECVKNGVVNKAIVYGANGVGKSNLGYAMFDIVSHLSDKNTDPVPYANYLNANSSHKIARFEYEFHFGEHTLIYRYGKTSAETLIYEALVIDNIDYLFIDRTVSTQAMINFKGAENLKRDMGESQISIINYVKNNAVLEGNDAVNNCFFAFLQFINGMLFYRSLHSNNYIGLEQGTKSIAEDIVEHGNVHDFERFLNNAGIECKLAVIDEGKTQGLAFDFDSKLIPFYEICSTGTRALSLFYFWLQRLRESSSCSFLFIDEFDAFYHYDLSALLVRHLREFDLQVILTTHNTSIMNNNLLRPDCYFRMDKTNITSLANATSKDLRAAHNLEKMYRAGSFDG